MMNRILALLILPVILPTVALGLEPVDLTQNRMLSLMPLPGAEKAVVGLVNASGQVGFALCKLQKAGPQDCKMDMSQRFSIAEMPSVKSRFESHLRNSAGSVELDGFEIGVMAALRFSPGEIALYYGMKSRESQRLTEAAIAQVGRLFNSDVNSPLYVPLPPGSSEVRILAALQFAATYTAP